MVIKKEGELYFVYSENGSRRLSKGFKTRQEAEKRLRQIEFFKNKDMKIQKFQSDKIDISNFDYEINDDTFVIYNVPIAAEIVQKYDDGYAYKPFSEIKNISVDQIPLTIVNSEPSHPSKLIGEMNTKERSEVIVGFMTEPSKPRSDQMAKPKKYADFVLHRTPKTKAMEDKVTRKESVDTSIGFNYEQLDSKGEFKGREYDYIQTNITLDHNAILIDSTGRTSVGRAPFPIAGIGADSNTKEEKKMDSENLKVKVDQLEAENKNLSQKLDSAQKSYNDLKAEFDQKMELDSDLRKETDQLKNELNEYRQERKVKVDQARKELSEKYPEMKEVFDSASEKVLLKQYDSFKEKQSSAKSKDIGADMMGQEGFEIKNDKSFENYTKVMKEKRGQ